MPSSRAASADVPVNTDLPVHTAWGIGVDDAMAIWCFQVYPDHLDIVDYYEGHGQGFDHYCAWLDERGYHGTDWYPHDAKVREAGSPGARSRIETLVSLGRRLRAGAKRGPDQGRQRWPQDEPARAIRRQEVRAGTSQPGMSFCTEWDTPRFLRSYRKRRLRHVHVETRLDGVTGRWRARWRFMDTAGCRRSSRPTGREP